MLTISARVWMNWWSGQVSQSWSRQSRVVQAPFTFRGRFAVGSETHLEI
jgi:hypothetical protein